MKKITYEEKLKIIKEYEEGYGYNYLAKNIVYTNTQFEIGFSHIEY